MCMCPADGEQGPANSAVDQQRNRVIAIAALKDADPLAGQGEPPPYDIDLVHFNLGIGKLAEARKVLGDAVAVLEKSPTATSDYCKVEIHCDCVAWQ